MRILHAASFAVQPWKNGGGTTTEVMASPAGAGLDAFDWRISMATVATPGPFSQFPGIDRTLGLLAGAGMTLDFGARGVVTLEPGDHPLAFPGDVPVSATLVGGPILDLNVMTRRGRWRHQLSRVRSEGGTMPLARSGDVTIALIRGAAGTADGEPVADGDAVLIDQDQTVLIAVAACEIWIADLWRL